MDTPRFAYQGSDCYRLVNVTAEGSVVDLPDGVEVLFVDLAVALAPSPSANLDLAASWAIATGMYVFLSELPGDLGRLRSQLQALHRAPAYGQVRFLWIRNPKDDLAQWQFQSLSVESDQVSRLTAFDLGGYALAIPRGTRLALENRGFLFSTTTAYVTTDYGVQQLQGVGEQLRLPLVGPHVGSWQFSLTLARSPAQPYWELSALDIGFRLFFKDPLFSTDLSEIDLDTVYQSLRYPLLDETAASRYPEDLTLTGCWRPFQPVSSFFSFAPLSGTDTFPPLPSGYRSNLGYTVYLTPQNTARLVFSSKPASSLASDLTSSTVATGLYLVPQGEFELTVPRHQDNPAAQLPDYDNNLMCGLSGVEYIKLSGNRPETATSYIGFQPNHSAFAPRYTPSQELTHRLRDLVSGYAQRPIERLQKGDILINLLNRQQVEEILSILFGEFFPLGYQLPEKAKPSLDQLFSNELSSLGEFETWAQQALRASYAQDETHIQAALTAQATTAWAYVRRSGEAAVYYAQPDQSILYKPSQTENLLNFLEVPATTLTGANIPRSFPLFAYGSLPAAITDCRELELQVVNPLRRSTIQQQYEQEGNGSGTVNPATTTGFRTTHIRPAALPSVSRARTADVAGGTISGTTPQGLLATFTEPDYDRMTELILARSTKNNQDQFLKFRSIPKGSALWSAFQSNQLLLLIDNAEALQASFNDDPDNPDQSTTQLTIDGWTFYLDTVDDSGKVRWRPESLLIFKYYNKPLLELIDQPSLWSQAATFVGDEQKIAEVRQRVRASLEDAIAKDTEGTPTKVRQRYAPLANIARNPNWSGILGLNIPIPPAEGLPDELKALAGGIDAEKFFAQYVGIDNTPIRPEAGSLVAEPSSLFALIDYENDQPPPPTDAGYNFQVLSLRVLFKNSHIIDFASEIAVTLDKLFGERTQLQETSDILHYDLALVSVERALDLPRDGKRLVVVAQLAGEENPADAYHIRIFDDAGQRLIDQGKGKFLPSQTLLHQLESLASSFQPPEDRNQGDDLKPLDPATQRLLIQNIVTQVGNNLSGRNLVKLQGSTENHNGRTTYAFSFNGNNRFLMPNSAVFNYIDIVKAQFSSDPIPDGENPTITGRFSFWTRLAFRQIEKFDAFSFGPTAEFPTEADMEYQRFLSAANLVVTLSFPLNDTSQRDFKFVPDGITFQPPNPQSNRDLTQSSFRPNSLYAKFPVTLRGFLQGQDKPKGFLDIKTVFGNTSLSETTWYGLSFDLDLGSLGALSSVAKLVAELAILWRPNTDPELDIRPDPQVYVGMKLPGLSGDVLGFPLQSVIKFSFKTAEFLFDPADGPENSTYLLKLKAIVLKLLVLSLPPNGQTELLIFGNSKGRDQPIGWYAAYAKEPAKKPP